MNQSAQVMLARPHNPQIGQSQCSLHFSQKRQILRTFSQISQGDSGSAAKNRSGKLMVSSSKVEVSPKQRSTGLHCLFNLSQPPARIHSLSLAWCSTSVKTALCFLA